MDPLKKKKLLAGLWEAFRSFILLVLKDLIVKKALKLFFKTSIGAVWQVKLVTVIAEELHEEIAKPLVNALLVEAGYKYDRHDGKGMVKKLKGATDAQTYNDAADDIMS